MPIDDFKRKTESMELESITDAKIDVASFFNDISILEIWRLFIDGNLQEKERGWLGFEERETGYLFNIIKSMAYALEHINEELTVELIQTLHKLALENVSNTSYTTKTLPKEKPGKTRCESCNYGLTKESLSKKGLNEIIEKIPSNLFLTLGYDKKDKNQFHGQQLNPTKATKQQKELYVDALYDYIARGGYIRISMSFDKIIDEAHNTAYYVELYLSDYIDTYLSAIDDAGNDIDKKLRAILTFAQDCEHMHVFVDGNGRLFYMVLLYFLCIQNNLPLPFMFNINRIAGFAIDELIIEVKQGWENKKILLTTGSLFGISIKEVLSTLTDKQREYYISTITLLTPYFKFGYQELEILRNSMASKSKNSELPVNSYSFWQPFPSTTEEAFELMQKCEKFSYKI